MKFFLLTLSIGFATIANAQYTKLFDFTGTANGGRPYGSLISDGTFLYGMTRDGGTNDFGAIFKIKPDGTGYSKLLDFGGAADGSYPSGSLISDGTFLYGMTASGGTNNTGIIFKIKPDGTGYSKLFDFSGVVNGSLPTGSLISDGTFLYGMTRYGGANNVGTIFKIKLDGTNYTKLLDFTGANGNAPWGSLISDGTFLYGMTSDGGTSTNCVGGCGTIFKIKLDGTGYLKLLDFTGTTNGNSPYGTLISDGTFFYGMTEQGGTSNWGVIFKIKPDGTGYSKLYNFTSLVGGSLPWGSLTLDGTFLYGMTQYGGTGSCFSNCGVLFKIKPDGTNYTKLLDFTGIASGSYPYGDVISDGSFLYGMTRGGGTNNMGTIFKYGLVTDIAENNTQNDFSIYPNPTTGIFSVKSENKISSIEIVNLLGEKIYHSELRQPKVGHPFNHPQWWQSEITNSELDLSSQPNGIYFISIKTEEGIANKKIIINK